MGFFITICFGLLGAVVINFLVTIPGKNLRRKFEKLGELKGKKLNDIISVVGSPNSVSAKVNDEGESVTVCQWLVSGFHIVLVFDKDEECLGISHVYGG